MKGVFIFLALLVCSLGMSAQEVDVGDELTLGMPTTDVYHHVSFPKKNFIMKRNGLANLKSAKGLRVTVIEKVDVGGATKVTLARKDGKRFFGMKRHVIADLKKALDSGELRI